MTSLAGFGALSNLLVFFVGIIHPFVEFHLWWQNHPPNKNVLNHLRLDSFPKRSTYGVFTYILPHPKLSKVPENYGRYAKLGFQTRKTTF